MKQTRFSILLALFAVFAFSSCIKNENIVWDRAPLAEWDLASYTAKPAGLPFPLLTQVPTNFGRAVLASGNTFGAPADPALSRTFTSTITMRVNLVGKPLGTAQTLPVRISNTYTTAVEGVHFELLDRTCVIPADSSFGFVRWRTLNPGTPPPATPAVRVIFELVGNGTVQPSENFKYIGWSIAQ